MYEKILLTNFTHASVLCMHGRCPGKNTHWQTIIYIVHTHSNQSPTPKNDTQYFVDYDLGKVQSFFNQALTY